MYESLVSVGIVDLVALPTIIVAYTCRFTAARCTIVHRVRKKGANLFFASNFAKC